MTDRNVQSVAAKLVALLAKPNPHNSRSDVEVIEALSDGVLIVADTLDALASIAKSLERIAAAQERMSGAFYPGETSEENNG